MQKFSESKEPLTNRKDIIVITDEAHRSQYGLKETIKKRWLYTSRYGQNN